MSPDDDDIRPRQDFWETAVIALAAVSTLGALGAIIFFFSIPASKPQAPPTVNEVTVGIFPSKPADGH